METREKLLREFRAHAKSLDHWQAFGAEIHVAGALVAMSCITSRRKPFAESGDGAGFPIHKDAHGADEGRQLAPDVPGIGRRTARGLFS